MDKIESSRLPKLPEAMEYVLVERLRSLAGVSCEGEPSENDLKPIAADVKQLSDYFTKFQGERPPFYLEKKRLMAAYVAYFLPANVLKIEKPLTELFKHPKIELGTDGSISVLDLGCGPGTAALGFMNYLLSLPTFETDVELRITVADNTSENIDEASILIKLFWTRCRESFEEMGITSFKLKQAMVDMETFERNNTVKGDFDIILLSNSLGELWSGKDKIERRVAFLESLAEMHLRTSGSIVVIEPALKKSSRELIEVRDACFQSERVCVYAPCTGCVSCNMLENKKDWCHESFAWEPPSIVRKLDGLTGFDKSELKYSYLVLRGDGLSLYDCYAGQNIYRVVSERLATKGISKVYLCGKNGRMEVSRLDRDKSPYNEFFDKMKRGDIVSLDVLTRKGDGWRIGSDSSVVIVQHDKQ